MTQRDVFVVGAARTAVGSFGGTLKDIPLTSLGTNVVRAALLRSDISPEEVGQVILGNVIPTEPIDGYLSRVAALNAGIPKEVTAFNINRLCGSGLQAIVSAAQSILLADVDVAIGGGAESMSRSPYLLPAMRWGVRMGETKMIDYMAEMLHDPWHKIHMGITAENVAARYGITREMQDQLALESQQRAAFASKQGRFREQIVSIETPSRKGTIVFDTDEHIRAEVTALQLEGMKPAFKSDGSVTAGNSSGINDGAAAVMLAEGERVKSLGLKPLARLVSYAHAGVEPEYMGLGPVHATRLALKRAGLQVNDLDVIESNEAFAAQACAVMKELELDPKKVNVNGSGISLGHPLGATGAINTVKAIYELRRTGGRYALVTMCIGGGQGIAVIFEACPEIS